MTSSTSELQKNEQSYYSYNQKKSQFTISNKQDKRLVRFTAIESGTVRGLFHRIENFIRGIFSNLFEKKTWIPLQLNEKSIDICIPGEIGGHDGLAGELRNSLNLTIDKLYALLYPALQEEEDVSHSTFSIEIELDPKEF